MNFPMNTSTWNYLPNPLLENSDFALGFKEIIPDSLHPQQGSQQQQQQHPKNFQPIYQPSVKKTHLKKKTTTTSITCPQTVYLEYLNQISIQKKIPIAVLRLGIFFPSPRVHPSTQLPPSLIPRKGPFLSQCRLALEVNAADSVGFFKGCPTSVWMVGMVGLDSSSKGRWHPRGPHEDSAGPGLPTRGTTPGTTPGTQSSWCTTFREQESV